MPIHNDLLHPAMPRMFYFGPWSEPGHCFFNEKGRWVLESWMTRFPFGHNGAKIPVDECLQPGCRMDADGDWTHQGSPEVQGEAALHHISGWTALSFWDRSVDTRPGCNSTYFAEGTFSFEQMVDMAKARFAARWNRMNFEVKLQQGEKGERDAHP